MARYANSVLFGFDFQSNAAIVLMIDNMADMDTIRIEGEEDIEIGLNDGTYVLAQAKSVMKASTDFANVRQKAQKAMKSLSEAAQKRRAKQLIYFTNSTNPFNDEASRPLFYGKARRKYSDLPDNTKVIIDGWLSDIDKPLDTDLLTVQMISFETDDDDERYKVVLEKISDFIGGLDLHLATDGLRKKLHDVWVTMLDRNGSKSNRDITLTKKDVVWPIIVFVTYSRQLYLEGQYYQGLDEDEIEEIERRYGELIEDTSERFDIVVKVITDYGEKRQNRRDAIDWFVNDYWSDYIGEFGLDAVEEPLKSCLTKKILHAILRKKIAINSIKQTVNL